MRHLVFVNRFFFPDNSATSQMLSAICFALAERGYRVSVVTSRQYYNRCHDQPRMKRIETIRGVDVIRLPAMGLGRANLLGRLIDYLAFLLQAASYLLVQLRSGELVIAKTDPPMLGVFLWPIVRVRGAGLINWFQDLFPEVLLQSSMRDVNSWGSRLLLRLRDRNCRHAVLNIALSDAMAEYLQLRGTPVGKVTVIPNFAPPDLKPVANPGNAVRNAMVQPDTFVVGYSGNLGRAHDWRTMLGLVKEMSGQEEFRFLFFGGGVGMEALRREAVRLSLVNVEFHPYKPSELLSQSLSAIDVHLVTLQPGFSSFIFPSKLYGIMAVRRPIVYIGSKECAIGRYLEATRCALVVEVGDNEGLRNAIIKLKTDGKLYSELANNGFREYQERYTLDRVVELWGSCLAPLNKG